MKALVYHGPGRKVWQEVPKPTIQHDTDAVVRVDAVTICGTDLHILKGDVPEVTPGRILGHEAVGTVEEIGPAVRAIKPGDKVLVSCITACGNMPVLPRNPLRAMRRRRRMDTGTSNRWDPSRVRPSPIRRYIHLSGTTRCYRRGAAHGC